jgi:hypothetical protein
MMTCLVAWKRAQSAMSSAHCAVEHHFTDVLAGSTLGIVIAVIFFFQAQASTREAQTLDVRGQRVSAPLCSEIDDGRSADTAVRTRTSKNLTEMANLDEVQMQD